MKKLVGTILILAMLLLGGSTAFGAQVSFGIRIGAPPPPRVVRVTPSRPGPDYTWVDGYWYPVGGHYRGHAGYWTLPPSAGAHWVAPRHDGQQYFNGYWTAIMAASSMTTAGIATAVVTATGFMTTTVTIATMINTNEREL